MKLIRNILLIATGLSMASCNYLDVNTDTKDRMSLEEVFTDETYTEQWLANAYSYLTNSRDFHWMRHWDYFIIPKFIG